MRRVRVGAVAVALMVVVGLGGCAVAPAAATKTSPPATASPQPTPTPTVAPIVAPTSRIPLDCAALVDPAGVATVNPALTFTPDPPVSPPYMRLVMREQAGNLNCTWTTPDQRSGSLAVTVSADTTGYQPSVWNGKPSIGVGDASWGDCPDGTFCQASVLAGDYWFTIVAGPVAHTSQKTAAEVFKELAASIASRLATAGPALPAWQQPETAWSPVVSCDTLGAAVPMTDVMGSGAADQIGDWNAPGDENAINRWAARSAVFYNCVWNWKNAPVNQGMLIVQVVPGGEWVWPQLEAAPNVTSTPLIVPGVDKAAYRCDTYPTCWADAIIDHSWVQLSGTSNGIPGIQDKMTKALTALAAFAASKN